MPLQDNRSKRAERLVVLGGQPARAAGMVWLVGAGPGDPELLTLKALKALQGADVVVHDGLVSDEILDLARASARRISVAKRKSRHSYSQDEINRMLVAFARDGLEVVGFSSAERLVAAIGGRRPDAILLDVRIPGQSGLDALKTLKDSEAADIPVLMLTGEGRYDRIVQAMQLGAKGYVMKPFDGPGLIGEVRAVLKVS